MFLVRNRGTERESAEMSEPPLPMYWWLEEGRHLFKRFQDQSLNTSDHWKLDPVKVAGRLDVRKLQNLTDELLTEGKPTWAVDVLTRLQAKNENEFSKAIEPKTGTEEDIEKPQQKTIPRNRLWILREMQEWGMIEEYPGRHPDPFRYVGVFAVVKACGVLFRIIFDCRLRNMALEPPPKMELATLATIFWTIAYFKFFATFDLRHYFYQIPVPEAARNLLLMACGDEVFRAKVLSMGIHIAPWLAENVAALVVVLATHKAGLHIGNINMNAGSTPGYLDIFDKRGNLVGRVIIWLDNFLLATHNETTRKALLEALCQHYQGVPGSGGILVQLRLVVKGSAYDPDKAETPTDKNVFKGVNLSEDNVDYMNVHFTRTGPRTVLWRHNDVARWNQIRTVPLGATYRYWASLVGILTWHWQLTGEDKGSISPVIELSSLIGGAIDFDAPFVITKDMQNALQPHVDKLFKNDECAREIPKLPRKVFFGTSDASKLAGAGVRWNRSRTKASISFGPEPWSKEESNEDINVRETLASARTISAMLEVDHDALLLMGTDNVTCKAAIRHGMYPGNPSVTRELQEMKKKIKERNCVIHIIHIPGKVMAADAPSRLAELDQERCKATLEILEKHWEILVLNEKRMNGSNNKRPSS